MTVVEGLWLVILGRVVSRFELVVVTHCPNDLCVCVAIPRNGISPIRTMLDPTSNMQLYLIFSTQKPLL